jgi:hypothetical protein
MQKTEIPGIYKAKDGILVNKDNDSLKKYRERRMNNRMKDGKINMLEDKLNVLANDMEEIKSLLKKLVE